MAKKPWDDIIKGVMQATKKGTASTAKKAATKKAAAPLSRAERSAANKAKAAADRAARMKAGSEASAKMRAIRKEKNRAEAIAGDLREMRTDWTRGTQIRKAKEFFGDEIGKALDREGATSRVLTKGSQARRTFLEKEIKKFRTMLEREGYPSGLTIGQQRDIARDALERAAKANKAASGRVEQVVSQAKTPKQKPLPKEKGRKGRRGQRNEAEQEVITTAARRQYRKELRKGTVGKGDDAARKRSREGQYAEQVKRQKKSVQQAKAGTGKPRGDKPKKKEEIVEQTSSKRLRAQQDANAKKRYDERVDRMTAKQREAMERRIDADRKRLRGVPDLTESVLRKRRAQYRAAEPKRKSKFGGKWED